VFLLWQENKTLPKEKKAASIKTRVVAQIGFGHTQNKQNPFFMAVI
jgi:hypothetical protein